MPDLGAEFQTRGAYTRSIYKAGTLTKCINNLTGVVEASSSDPDTVFQTAITGKGDIYVYDGSYVPSGSFTGWNFINFTKLCVSRNAIINIPNGYSGYVFKLPSSCQNVVVSGGIVQESGATPLKNWDCFLLEGNTDGVYSNLIEDMRVLSPNRFANLLISDAAGWINCNWFRNIWAWWAKTAFIDFQVTGTGGTGFGRNLFTHMVLQSSTADTSMIGVKNINGSGNVFLDVEVWDVTPPQKMATIASTALDTTIIGGIMTSPAYFTDNSSPSTTQIIDSFTKAKFSALTLGTPLASSALPTTAVQTNQANAFGVFNQNFRSGTLGISNPANTFLYQFVGSAITASRLVTLPLLTANDEAVMKDFGQTLTTKTHVLASNTFTDTSAALGDLVKHNGTKFLRFPKGTANQFLTVNSGGTDLVWTTTTNITTPIAKGTASKNGDSSTKVFTIPHSMGSAPVFANVIPTSTDALGSYVITHDSTNITVTYQVAPPTGTGNLTFEWIAVDALGGGGLTNILGANFLQLTKMAEPAAAATNSLNLYVDTVDTHLKQKDSNSGVIDITAMVGPIRGKKMGRFDGTASLNGSGIFAGNFTAINSASGSISSTTNGNAGRFTSGAVAGNSGGVRYAIAYTTRAWNPYLGVRFKIGTATNNRVIVGWNNGTVPTDGNDDPLLNLNGVMLVQRSTDTTFQISTNAGTATSTFVNTGVTVDNTTVYTFEIRADATNNKFQWSLNGSAWADLTSNIPSATFYMAFMALVQTAEAVAHTIDIFAVETVSDK